jgi:putative alpha-1,2-mannosidase
MTLIDRKRTADFINTFIKQYEQGGKLPVWELASNETECMIGYHAVSVIADAMAKGIRVLIMKSISGFKKLCHAGYFWIKCLQTKQLYQH